MALTITQVTPTPTNRITTATTFVLTDVGASFAVDDMLVLCIGADNSNTGGAAPTVSGVTDSAGNTYVSRTDTTQNTQNAGAGGIIYTSLITNALVSTDDITITFTLTTASVAVRILKIANDGVSRALYVSAGANSESVATTPVGVTTGSMTSGDTVIGMVAVEGTNTIIADADTTNGNWSSVVQATANAGSAAASMISATQWKTVSAGGTQTFNVTWSTGTRDIVSAYVTIRPETIPGGAGPLSYGRRVNQAVQRAAVI